MANPEFYRTRTKSRRRIPGISWYKAEVYHPSHRIGSDRTSADQSQAACLSMNPGFYTIMAAQFFSSLADNALFVVAILTTATSLFFYLKIPYQLYFKNASAENVPPISIHKNYWIIAILGFVLFFAFFFPNYFRA